MSKQVRKRSRPTAITDQQSAREDEPNKEQRDNTVTAISEDDLDESVDCSPEDAKLRLVSIMMIRGHTQEEIAKYFKVDSRTVRNWKKKLAGLKLGIVESLDPAGEIDRFLVLLTSAEVELRMIKKEALARSEFGTAIRCEKELVQLAVKRVELLSKLGVFARFDFAHSDGDDPGKAEVNLLAEMLQLVHTGVTEGSSDSPSEAE